MSVVSAVLGLAVEPGDTAWSAGLAAGAAGPLDDETRLFYISRSLVGADDIPSKSESHRPQICERKLETS